jgi:RNA polymerase sigma-70 factor (ECF subfamily)
MPASTAIDDADLNARFRAGDEAAVRDVYARYGGAMFAVAMAMLSNRELASECVQQAFVRAWRSSRTFDPDRELRPWLATITRRTAIDMYRRAARTRSVPQAEVDDTVIPLAFENTWEVFEVRAALDQLPADEREVVRLSHFEGLPHTEIAERLQVPVGTVKSRSHRAHRRLAGLLSHLVEASR